MGLWERLFGKETTAQRQMTPEEKETTVQRQIAPEEKETLRVALDALARSERTLEFLRKSVQFKGTTGEPIAAAVLTEIPLFAHCCPN